MPGEITLANHF